MKDLLNKGKKMFGSVTDKVSQELSSKFALVKEVVNGLPVLVSSQKSSKYATLYDEKHYFVIPFVTSDTGFSLHSMRCLPDSVPEINDLPKRRIFHFPNEHYEGCLKLHMLEMARENALSAGVEKINSLEQLANDIDELDKKLTYGMLLVGSIAAIFNPLIGAGIAVKAVLPGVGSLLNKYGIRPAGEKLSRAQVEQAAEQAQEQVANEFAQSDTLKVENPILQELELALRTSEQEHDPLIDPNLANGSIPQLDSERWRELTEIAIYNVYKDTYQNPAKHQEAKLGPEDIRWFDTMFEHMD